MDDRVVRATCGIACTTGKRATNALANGLIGWSRRFGFDRGLAAVRLSRPGVGQYADGCRRSLCANRMVENICGYVKYVPDQYICIVAENGEGMHSSGMHTTKIRATSTSSVCTTLLKPKMCVCGCLCADRLKLSSRCGRRPDPSEVKKLQHLCRNRMNEHLSVVFVDTLEVGEVYKTNEDERMTPKSTT